LIADSLLIRPTFLKDDVDETVENTNLSKFEELVIRDRG
jgi:hypothetical protein